jgi:hypothetical protein
VTGLCEIPRPFSSRRLLADMKTANSLGLVILAAVLPRANRVIE